MQTNSEQISLLIVENDSNTLESIKALLLNKVENIITASNSEDGLNIYLKHTPEIVISSINLPELTSIDMCKNIIRHNKDINIVLIVDSNDSKELINALELGIDDFILKPIQNDLVTKKLDKIIQTINHKHTIEKQNAQIKNYLDFIEKKLTTKQSNPINNQDKNTNHEYENIANIGSWKHNLVSNKLFWSKEIYNVLEIDSNTVKPSYEKFLTLITPTDRERVNKIHEKTISENIGFNVDFSIVLKDGSHKFLNEKCKTVFDKDNKPLYTIGTIQDISKYKQLYNNLEKSEKIMISQSKYATMGEILTMIMHQWRQPITTISMIANNLLVDIELEELENDSVQKGANSITEQTQYLSKTIDDFRAFFKHVKLPEETSMKNIFDETANIMINSLTSSEIELKQNFDGNITIKTYKRELLQVLINIVKNAKDALVENTQNDRFIEVNVNESDTGVEILISDNAGGIKEEILTKIFEPYFTTKDENTGTGLGLYMSKKIIEDNLKGILKVNNIESGVCFTISLPKTI